MGEWDGGISAQNDRCRDHSTSEVARVVVIEGQKPLTGGNSGGIRRIRTSDLSIISAAL